MEHNEWRLTHGLGGVGCLTPSHPHTKTLETCSGKTNLSHRSTIHMVPKSNLDGNSC